MPTKHRRIPVVRDEAMSTALEYFQGPRSRVPDTQVVREAVFEGAALEALAHLAAEGDHDRVRARSVLAEMLDLIETLDLPAEVRDVLTERVAPMVATDARARRRQKQMALLGSPNPLGETTLDLLEEADELERESL